jgi:uncharacterized membrane protein
MTSIRFLRHLFFFPWWVRARFPTRTLDAIERAVRDAEALHRGEIRFAVEGSLALPALLRAISARQRAAEVFSLLRVWDTAENSGVLIYLLLADRDVEIVADRGISARVAPEEWQRICGRMEEAFGRGEFESGAVNGIRAVGELLARHFPAGPSPVDELPDRPIIL